MILISDMVIIDVRLKGLHSFILFPEHGWSSTVTFV